MDRKSCVKVKRGLSVKFSEHDKVTKGCMLDSEFDICNGVITSSNDCSNGYHDPKDSTLFAIDNIELPCEYGSKNCKNFILGCQTDKSGVYPKFDTEEECKKWTSTSKNTFGSCVKHIDIYGTSWILSCETDADCNIGNSKGSRKCITDTDPTNISHKTCSCSTNDDCVYPHYKNESGNNECIYKLPGTISCDKI